ncbi:uncharacterized protein M6B38_397365 [Iris pallida]|uniref:Uncharacterized protein n=1 Tax=Iris pallida TaxID=29817 RepID=A0AAX6FV58_IRIPA|nr:uncharacterized protein M6B38_397365 [Iris pallida]
MLGGSAPKHGSVIPAEVGRLMAPSTESGKATGAGGRLSGLVSYSTAVMGHSATGPAGGSSRVSYRPAVDVDGRKVVIFSMTDMEALTAPCGLDLIGKFARRRLPIEAIKKDFASRGFRGLIEVKAIDDRHVLIRPNDESDFLRLDPRTVGSLDGSRW